MKNSIAILSGIGVGALLMYLFDPRGGRRRRALIRDKAVGISHDMRDAIDKKSRDLSNRAQGLLHEAKSVFSSGKSDETAAPAGSTPNAGTQTT